MNLYNVMVYYKGEADLNMRLPLIGDVKIYNGKPIYIENAPYNVIEALRQYRTLMIDIKINAGSEGAYQVYNYSNYSAPMRQVRPRQEIEQVSNNDIQSILRGASNGPIVVDEPKKKVESEKETNEDLGSYKLPSGKFEGMTLAEVDKEGKLKAVYNGFKTRNAEVKEAIEKYYNSKID